MGFTNIRINTIEKLYNTGCLKAETGSIFVDANISIYHQKKYCQPAFLKIILF